MTPAELAAITRRSPNGVRLLITIMNWDEECRRPPDVDRVFATAAAAERWSQRYELRALEACDYSKSLQPA